MTDTIENTRPTKRPRRRAHEPHAEGSSSPAMTANLVAANPRTKASLVEGLLLRIEGASLDDLCQATGWQPHTCRAFLTGLRKKGHDIAKAKVEGTTRYQIKAVA